MAVLRKIKKSWWLDYCLYGRRFRIRIGENKKLADRALAQIKEKIEQIRAREFINSLHCDYLNGCQICGYDLITETHHFIPKSYQGSTSPTNQVFLCPNHHGLLHLALSALRPGKETKNNDLKEKLERALTTDVEFGLFFQKNAAQIEQAIKLTQDYKTDDISGNLLESPETS